MDQERPSGSIYTGERDLATQAADPPADKPGWYDRGKERRYWDGEKWGDVWTDPLEPGWTLKDGTLRYFDGEKWTEHVAPPYPTSITTGGIAGAAFLGVLAALFVVWLGAQISPEHVYLPVKFVVKELPGFR
jgi:hypothetical protein